MEEVNKNHIKVQAHSGSIRLTIPQWKVKEMGLEAGDMVDISKIKKVVEKKIS